MKRHRLLLLAGMLVFAAEASAQNFLNNPGFETWNGGLPGGWRTDTVSCQRSSVSHSGTYSIRLNHSNIMGIPFMGTLNQDTILVSGAYFSLKGWYQFYPQGGDGFLIGIFVHGHPTSLLGTLVGAGSQEFYDAKSVYTAFSVGVEMMPGSAGDTASITIYTLPDTASDEFHSGSYVLFDDLVLDNTLTDVRTANEFVRPASFSLSQNYPNPFNPTTQIEFAVPRSSNVTLKVYNSMGQEVRTLVDREFQVGRYRAIFNGAGLASGIYFYKMVAGDFVQSNKMMLVK